MSETMLERMAIAIHPEAWEATENRLWAKGAQFKATQKARAALEAIREPDAAMIRAAAESDADDGEGGTFGPMCDLLGFSGENKARLVIFAALRASVDSILSQSQEGK